MISYLSGKIIAKKENFVILEVQGVGYEVFVSARSMEIMPEIRQELKLFCYLDVGERSLKLFGFLSYEELELFKIIRNIQGIGPRAALEISSFGSLEKIKKEIEKSDTKFLEGLSGIGKKKAAKIILELSGQFKAAEKQKPKEPAVDDEALSALMALGFSKNQAKEALSQMSPEINDSQQKIKEALKILGKCGKRL